MARKEIKGPINDSTLNNTNHNFKELYDGYNNVVEEVSNKAYAQVVDAAKINWKDPVDSFGKLPTSADEGDTRMARDTGKVYRFDGENWNEIQQIDVGPVNELDSRLTSRLAETEQDLQMTKGQLNTEINNTKDRVSDLENQVGLTSVKLGNWTVENNTELDSLDFRYGD